MLYIYKKTLSRISNKAIYSKRIDCYLYFFLSWFNTFLSIWILPL